MLRAWLDRVLLWRDPDKNLAAFAETEACGARDLARAAEQIRDPWIRRQLIRHAQDEIRHAALLGEEASSVQRAPLGAALLGESPSAASVDVEGLEGEIPFLAFVHAAEKRAVHEFELHADALGRRGEIFERILADEQRHVEWTHRALEGYRAAGRGEEVDRALRSFERGRWKALGLGLARRISSALSAVFLTLLFYVLLAPFKLLAGHWRTGWVAPSPTSSLEHES